IRALKPETEPRILVSDTVGFIKKLPHQLVASFRSTLDEAREASFLLFVADASNPTFRSQLATTREVLGEIGAGAIPWRLLLNKRDRLDDTAIAALEEEFPDALIVSARDLYSVGTFRVAILSFVDAKHAEDESFVPYPPQTPVRHSYESATVLGERHDAQ